MIHYFFYQGLMIRMAGAAVVSFLIVIVLAPRFIRYLIKYKVGDRPEFDHVDLNQLSRHKTNTPTMGGLLIVVAIFVSLLLFADLGNTYILYGLIALLWLAVVGFVDDFMKLRRAAGTGTRDGLKSWEKFMFQLILAVLLSIFIQYYYGKNVESVRMVYVPFIAEGLRISILAHIIITVLTMVGTSNAVNLTDGMDGLAGGCMVILAGAFLIITWIGGVTVWAKAFNLEVVRYSAEMTVLCASIMGACLGFLWYNSHPAQVFMGDTGSLTLGGLIGYVAVVTRHELLLLIAGGVFVMEAVSVIIQVGVFKMTKSRGQGQRVFRCAPVHHHFHLGGWAESKVVVRFWLLGIVFAALALATLPPRRFGMDPTEPPAAPREVRPGGHVE